MSDTEIGGGEEKKKKMRGERREDESLSQRAEREGKEGRDKGNIKGKVSRGEV